MHRLIVERSMIKSFRELLVWQKSMDLANRVYTATAKFPREELFGLTSQLRRAAISIPSNIAEGRAIGGGRFLHHIRIAIGSEAELETQIELALRRSYVDDADARALVDSAVEVRQMLHGLHRALKARRIKTAGATVLLLLSYSALLFT
jgi:four helix bundle protein